MRRGPAVALLTLALAAGPALLGSAAWAAGSSAPRPVKVVSGAGLHSQIAYYAALAAIFVALALVVGIALSAVHRDAGRVRVRRRLSVYTLTGRAAVEREDSGALGGSAVARSAVDLAGRVVQSRDLENRLGRKLEGAGLPLRPAEWLVIHSGIAVVLALLLFLVAGANPVAALIGLAVGALGPVLYLSLRESRRTAAFLSQLPDTLQLLAGSLSVGYSLPQAVDAVARESSEPVAGELHKALVEARLGLPLEDALDGVATRMRSRDFGWVVMAIRIQRQVGGNLSEVLTNAANTLRERDYLRRQVKVLSAEGRLSALILYALPFVFAGYLSLVRPGYVAPLFTDPLGIVMVVVGCVLLVIGGLWLRRAIRVEV
jgi:tight adherence protein B